MTTPKKFDNGKYISAIYSEMIGRFKSCLDDYGRTKKYIAEKLNISTTMLYNYLNDRHEMPISVMVDASQKFGFNLIYILQGGDVSKTYEEAIQSGVSSVRDKLTQYYNKESKKINEVMEALYEDPELLETVWHLVKTNEGMKKLTKKKIANKELREK